MTRVTPTQVVTTLDKLFARSPPDGRRNLHSGQAPQLQGVLDLVREIPSELIVLPEEAFAEFTLALSTIRQKLAHWLSVGQEASTLYFTGMPDVLGRDAVTVIIAALMQCPDEFPPAGTTDLPFIQDQQIRDGMRQDIGAANRAFQNAEWKAATVLGGAAIEALLHWKLSDPPTPIADLRRAATAAATSGKLNKAPKPNLDDWGLADFVAVAAELGVIKEATFKAAEIARDYRNFIHPGRAARRKQVCDRGTALAVLSGLEHVIRDLN